MYHQYIMNIQKVIVRSNINPMHTNPIIVHWNTLAYHFSYHPAFSMPDFACFCALLSIIARLLQCQNHELLTFCIN